MQADLAGCWARPSPPPSPTSHFEFLFMTVSEAVSRHETWGGTFGSDLRMGCRCRKRVLRLRAVPGVAMAVTRLVIIGSSSAGGGGGSPEKCGRLFLWVHRGPGAGPEGWKWVALCGGRGASPRMKTSPHMGTLCSSTGQTRGTGTGLSTPGRPPPPGHFVGGCYLAKPQRPTSCPRGCPGHVGRDKVESPGDRGLPAGPAFVLFPRAALFPRRLVPRGLRGWHIPSKRSSISDGAARTQRPGPENETTPVFFFFFFNHFWIQ